MGSLRTQRQCAAGSCQQRWPHRPLKLGCPPWQHWNTKSIGCENPQTPKLQKKCSQSSDTP
eukprot:4452091-Amphidinium_carterae.1